MNMQQLEEVTEGTQMGQLWARDRATEANMLRRIAAGGRWTKKDRQQSPMMTPDQWCRFWENYAGTEHPSEEFVRAFIAAALAEPPARQAK